jgi:hypothetical protein
MKNLFTAIVEAQKEMPHITFDAKVKVRMKSGGEYTFEYASLAPCSRNGQKRIVEKRAGNSPEH